MEILSLKSISFSYRDNVNVLSDISFSVENEDFLVVLGPNGSGKTTLMGIASGVLCPQNGSAFLNGKEIKTFDRKELARVIAYVPQSMHVDFPFTCREIVLMGRYAHLSGLGFERKIDMDIAEAAMKMTASLHLADRYIHQLSGGERQRVLIAQAIAAQPQVMILDEPVSALDIKYRMQILDLLYRLNRDWKMTIVTILHDLNLACGYAKRVIIIKDGKIAGIGDPCKILTTGLIKDVFNIDVEILPVEKCNQNFIFPLGEAHR